MEEKVEEDRKIKKKKDDLLLPPDKKPFHSNATNHYAIDDLMTIADDGVDCVVCDARWLHLNGMQQHLEWKVKQKRTRRMREGGGRQRSGTEPKKIELVDVFFCCNARRWRAKFEILLTSRQATDWRVEKHHGLMVVAFASLKDDHGYLVSIV